MPNHRLGDQNFPGIKQGQGLAVSRATFVKYSQW